MACAVTNVPHLRERHAALLRRRHLSSCTFVSYHISNPSSVCDAQAVLTGPRPHIFTAVTSSEAKAHGGQFLRQNLARELQSQLGACRGDVLAAFK